MAVERNPFVTPPAGTPAQQEPPGFNAWQWSRRHPLLALLIAVWLAATVYGIALGLYLFATDPT